MSNIIVGLDIGTSFVRVVIAENDDDGHLEIIGCAKKPSAGLRNGVIVNIDAATSVIKETIEEAEQEAGVEVTSVYTAVGGSQVESLNSRGAVAVDPTSKNRALEISESAKKRAIEVSHAVPRSPDKSLIHVIPQEYTIDTMSGVKDPIGMMGVRLEVAVHLVTASITALSNINQSLIRAGYQYDDIMLKTLASTYATVHEDERELGSILIDLGGGTTDVMVLNKGAPVYTCSIPVGGNLVTSDISVVKGIPISVAEKIKIEKGCCWIQGNEKEEEVIIPGVGGRPPELTNRYELCEIIASRMEEIFTLVKKDVVRNSNLKKLSGSIVLTGGGSLMPGVVELCESVWGTSSVRVGCAPDLGGADQSYREPDFATVTGLVIANKDSVRKEKGHKSKRMDSSSGEGKMGLLKSFIKKFF